jgi:hypothetical protein
LRRGRGVHAGLSTLLLLLMPTPTYRRAEAEAAALRAKQRASFSSPRPDGSVN